MLRRGCYCLMLPLTILLQMHSSSQSQSPSSCPNIKQGWFPSMTNQKVSSCQNHEDCCDLTTFYCNKNCYSGLFNQGQCLRCTEPQHGCESTDECCAGSVCGNVPQNVCCVPPGGRGCSTSKDCCPSGRSTFGATTDTDCIRGVCGSCSPSGSVCISDRNCCDPGVCGQVSYGYSYGSSQRCYVCCVPPGRDCTPGLSQCCDDPMTNSKYRCSSTVNQCLQCPVAKCVQNFDCCTGYVCNGGKCQSL